MIDTLITDEHELAEALFIFSVNVDKFPDSANAYDSLAEVFMIKGDKMKAIEYYGKSLELNPDNTNARDKISILKGKERSSDTRSLD